MATVNSELSMQVIPYLGWDSRVKDRHFLKTMYLTDIETEPFEDFPFTEWDDPDDSLNTDELEQKYL